MTPVSLLTLPPELVVNIALQLPTCDVLSLASTCQRLHSILSDEYLWEKLFARDFLIEVFTSYAGSGDDEDGSGDTSDDEDGVGDAGQSWREVYTNHCFIFGTPSVGKWHSFSSLFLRDDWPPSIMRGCTFLEYYSAIKPSFSLLCNYMRSLGSKLPFDLVLNCFQSRTSASFLDGPVKYYDVEHIYHNSWQQIRPGMFPAIPSCCRATVITGPYSETSIDRTGVYEGQTRWRPNPEVPMIQLCHTPSCPPHDFPDGVVIKLSDDQRRRDWNQPLLVALSFEDLLRRSIKTWNIRPRSILAGVRLGCFLASTATTGPFQVRVYTAQHCQVDSFRAYQAQPDIMFIYHIEIEVAKEAQCHRSQLVSRLWRIHSEREGLPVDEEVAGPKVVGKEPILEAGSFFSYESCTFVRRGDEDCHMEGHFGMVELQSGREFNIAVGRFHLRPLPQLVLNPTRIE